MSRIGGTIDAAGLALLAGEPDGAEYRRRAERHRPDLPGLRAEALRMFHAGLQARDIAGALRVAEDVVQGWLARGTS